MDAPPEAYDEFHPDHDLWVEKNGTCYAGPCDRHYQYLADLLKRATESRTVKRRMKRR